MTFVDTNVFMLAVGREHPLRKRAGSLLTRGARERRRLVTSSEVLQELLHAYLRSGRLAMFDSALTLVSGCVSVLWSVEAEDIEQARALADVHPGLSARDLVHLACCQRRGVNRILTFDRALAAASLRPAWAES